MLTSLCVPFILGTSPLSVFSTTDYEELEEEFERMKGEQTTWF